MNQPCWLYTVLENDAVSDRLDKWITLKMESGAGEWNLVPPPSPSRTLIQNLIKDGHVSLNGLLLDDKTAKKTELKSGDAIVVRLQSPTALSLEPENIPIDILYQDEHIVVINKPQGLTVHPSETQLTGTLVHALLHHIKDLSGIGGKLRPGIVHRLDKNTSGALVVSKSDAAHQKLVEMFSRHDLERRYWALVYGDAPKLGPKDEYKVTSLIDRSSSDRKKMSMDVKTGREAITYLKRLKTYCAQETSKPFASWIEARLETGRTHQVRVHLTGLNASIFGDSLYGIPTESQPKWKALPPKIREAVSLLNGQALHAHVLGFHHPITGVWLRFEAEPPEYFQNLIKLLDSYHAY